MMATDRYVSSHKAFTQLGKGDEIFLVTVRPPEKLWLVAVLEAPKRRGDAWVADANTTPVRDITGFVKAPKGKLAMSLQSPRVLDDDQVAALRETTKAASKAAKSGRLPEVERALKLLTSGRRAKDQDDVVAAALFAVDYPAWDQPLPTADSLTPMQHELARALADRMEVSTGRWVYPGTPYAARRWLGLEKAGGISSAPSAGTMWRVMQKSAAAARKQFAALSTRQARGVFGCAPWVLRPQASERLISRRLSARTSARRARARRIERRGSRRETRSRSSSTAIMRPRCCWPSCAVPGRLPRSGRARGGVRVG
ncbi:MAG: hypothetical protein IPJ34_26930 [Myxococcales bacterium]|nr:hypothetical protein [Myxococcales bacterium]